jgi:hypothetical protein
MSEGRRIAFGALSVKTALLMMLAELFLIHPARLFLQNQAWHLVFTGCWLCQHTRPYAEPPAAPQRAARTKMASAPRGDQRSAMSPEPADERKRQQFSGLVRLSS